MTIRTGLAQFLRRPSTPTCAAVGNGLLPTGEHYALTWNIPESFGGMTTALLRRSTDISRLDERRVEVLTLAPGLDPRARERDLRGSGLLGADAHLRNLWDDLSRWSDPQLRRMVGTVAHPKPDQGKLQTDYRRRGGSVYASDRRDAKKAGVAGGRLITLFDSAGRVMAQWRSATSFYAAWLDAVIGDEHAYIVSDSKMVGGLLHGYRRPNVVVAQVLHNPHLKDPAGPITGELNAGKLGITSHLDSFDCVITQTDRQADDLRAAQLVSAPVATVPNAAPRPQGSPAVPRDGHSGVMIARLESQKRVDHAIEAIALCSTASRLDIYGEGTLRGQLEERIAQRGLSGRVRLLGHRTDARQRFRDASFSVLSSRFEGQGMVLLESMAAGCIPIAYDVKYGPADIISDGVDGFLVPAGDVAALAAAIRRAVALSPDELAKMRAAAQRRALDFESERIVRRWGAVLRAVTPAEDGKDARADTASADAGRRCTRPRADAGSPGIRACTDGIVQALPGGLGVRARLELAAEQPARARNGLGHGGGLFGAHGDRRAEPTKMPEAGRAFVVWQVRDRPTLFGRAEAVVDGDAVVGLIPADRLADLPEGILDLSFDVLGGRTGARLRVGAALDSAIDLDPENQAYATIHGNLSVRHRPGQARGLRRATAHGHRPGAAARLPNGASA